MEDCLSTVFVHTHANCESICYIVVKLSIFSVTVFAVGLGSTFYKVVQFVIVLLFRACKLDVVNWNHYSY